MENRYLEHLFKDKLSGMVIEPSAAAREVISKKIGLIKQRILVRRISIAASILLLATVGILAFWPDKAEKADLTHDDSMILDQPENIAESNDVTIAALSEEEKDLTDGELDLDLQTHGDIPTQTESISEMSVQEYADIDRLPSQEEGLAVMEESETNIEQSGETVQIVTDHIEKDVYVEYTLEDPEMIDQPQEKQYEPVKITIEYIASGKNREQTEDDRKKFYSKLDNIKSVDEVLGDIRTYKDRLFALDFKKENKVKDEENPEK